MELKAIQMICASNIPISRNVNIIKRNLNLGTLDFEEYLVLNKVTSWRKQVFLWQDLFMMMCYVKREVKQKDPFRLTKSRLTNIIFFVICYFLFKKPLFICIPFGLFNTHIGKIQGSFIDGSNFKISFY